MTADIFGAKNVGQNYPFVFLAYGAGGIGGPILGGFLGDLGNFPMAFTTCGVLCLVGAVLTWHCNTLNAQKARTHGDQGHLPTAVSTVFENDRQIAPDKTRDRRVDSPPLFGEIPPPGLTVRDSVHT